MKSEQDSQKDRIYPCEDCGKLRSKDEGGTVFTVCDECWDKHYEKMRSNQTAKRAATRKG